MCMCACGACACVMVDAVVLPLENRYLKELCDLWACREYHREHLDWGRGWSGILASNQLLLLLQAEKEEFGYPPKSPQTCPVATDCLPIPSALQHQCTGDTGSVANRTIWKDSPASLTPESALCMELSRFTDPGP